MRTWGTAIALSVAICLGTASAWSDDDAGAAIRASMQRIFASMKVLLPASVERGGFADPARAVAIQRALASVSEAAGAAAEHAGKQERGALFLGRSLEFEASQALQLFERGEREGAQYTVLQMVEYCAECHSRSAPASDSKLTEGFVASVTTDALEPEERARLQFATRQFDAGLETLERFFASKEISGVELLPAITNHLVVSLRVKRDFGRARKALETVSARPDLWTYVRVDVDQWIAALGSLAGTLDASDSPKLESALRVLDGAGDVARFASDRQALVHYVVASALLQRFVETDASAAEKARAYYLLGVVESRIGRSYWLALPYFYLEAAIELDPAGDAALQAFALIEEETLFNYALDEAGTVVELPIEVEQRLERLRLRIEAARKGRLPSGREVRDVSELQERSGA